VLDLDHLGPKISQYLRRPRPCQNTRKIKDAQAGEGILGCFGVCHARPYLTVEKDVGDKKLEAILATTKPRPIYRTGSGVDCATLCTY
jgi:hypothetical protein